MLTLLSVLGHFVLQDKLRKQLLLSREHLVPPVLSPVHRLLSRIEQRFLHGDWRERPSRGHPGVTVPVVDVEQGVVAALSAGVPPRPRLELEWDLHSVLLFNFLLCWSLGIFEQDVVDLGISVFRGIGSTGSWSPS